MSVCKGLVCGSASLLLVLWLAAVCSALEQQQDMDAVLQRTRRAYFSKKDVSDSVGVSDCLAECHADYQSCTDSCVRNPGCPLFGCLFKKHACNKTCYARMSRREAPADDMLLDFD